MIDYKWILLTSIVFLPTFIFGQLWEQALSIGGEGNEEILQIIKKDDGTFLGGSFDEPISVQGVELESVGDNDLFLFYFDENESLQWSTTIGSTQDDDLTGAALNSQNELHAFGEIWFEAVFGDTIVEVTMGSNALFISQYDENGALNWVRLIEGSGLKASGELAVDHDDNVWITGSFSNSLTFGDSTISAVGEQDLFIAKWTQEGELHWVSRVGEEGVFRAVPLDIDSEGNALISGSFQGKASFNTTVIQSNTPDDDVYLAKWNPDGEILWALKLGGVLEAEYGDLAVGKDDITYVTGSFFGSISPGDDLFRLNSDGFNTDVFLYGIDSEGQPVLAKKIGSNDEDVGAAITTLPQSIILGGHFEGSLIIDGSVLNATPGFLSSFVLAMDANGNVQQITDLSSTGFMLLRTLTANTDGSVCAAGTFQGITELSGIDLEAIGKFDGFSACLSPTFTPLDEKNKEMYTRSLFPNPFNEKVNFNQPANVWIYNNKGELMGFYEGVQEINTSNWEDGLYYFQTKKWRGKGIKVGD